ncbi:YicC/YloC family endoribonuclease [Orrella sp. JC864]|uniref:YicC/YloC family endoribonuclease n=1 Tax=Orrella sp. JC864 TaxID=3120298 RepID=UPI00300BB547
MLDSMTAFGSAQVDLDDVSVTVELRSVNSRFLDLQFRLPEDLRLAEAPLRELLGAALARGKVEVRAAYTRRASAETGKLDPQWLQSLAQELQAARAVFPHAAEPTLSELLNWPSQRASAGPDLQAWSQAVVEAARQALAQLQQARRREGQRLAAVMMDCARQVGDIVQKVETLLPQLLADHREKQAAKLRDVVEQAFPGGFAHIGGAELSERLAAEATLFSLRIDVAEELARLRSHIQELEHILTRGEPAAGKRAGSAGKRLDFLFQEMNREANTLGSKAGGLEVTRAAMDLKLLIEQMREQAQNIE